MSAASARDADEEIGTLLFTWQVDLFIVVRTGEESPQFRQHLFGQRTNATDIFRCDPEMPAAKSLGVLLEKADSTFKLEDSLQTGGGPEAKSHRSRIDAKKKPDRSLVEDCARLN